MGRYLKKGGHGGKRKGSGRKPSGDTPTTYSLRITREQAEVLKTWGGGDMSAGLRWLIAAAEPLVVRKMYGTKVP